MDRFRDIFFGRNYRLDDDHRILGASSNPLRWRRGFFSLEVLDEFIKDIGFTAASGDGEKNIIPVFQYF